MEMGDLKSMPTGDVAPYEENLYSGDLQLLESFFNGNINELDYLTDLPTDDHALLSAEDAAPVACTGDMSTDLLSSFIKHEPASPSQTIAASSPSSSSSPSSPGESSGPSSPETSLCLPPSFMIGSLETINPASLMMPTMQADGTLAQSMPQFGQHQLVEVKKAPSNKRGRFSSSDDEMSSPPTPLPANCTPDEERQIKRQRRLIKNRESAQKSRLRKKMYIEELETKWKDAVSQNETLLQENNVLKEEIKFLHRFIDKTPGLAEEIARNRPKGAAAPSQIRNVKAAGVCLLVVLFSFGLFFNNVQQFGDNGPAMPFEGRSREPIPEVVPFGGDRRYGRMLKSFKDAVPSLVSETEEVGGDLTPIYPKRRLPPVDAGPLDAVIQRNKKVGSGLSPYKKIKVEEDSMDLVDPACAEEVAKGFLSVSDLPEVDGLLPESAQFEDFVSQGPRNDTGAETTGYTDN
jgi:hypothetical protein